MQSRFEHFAVTSMMGSPDHPPRADGALKFSRPWERTAFGVALALSRDGHFEWEDFRQHLIAAIGDWEGRHEIDDPSWNYYDQWLSALEAAVIAARLASEDEIASRATAAQAAHLCCK
jgi:nitrile hydratase accessory protein